MEQISEGQLFKYTNVMKGWQHRWFVLNLETGILEYYMSEDGKKSRPRGSINLSGAVISPSEEDSNTFNVNSAAGELYRLRASDAKERQMWVNRLRSVAERHGQVYGCAQQSSPSPTTRDFKHHTTSVSSNSVPDMGSNPLLPNRVQQKVMCNTHSIYNTFSAAQDILFQAEINHHTLANAIEELSGSGSELHCTDHELLLLKATSQATLLCLKQCLGMLQHQQQATSFSTTGVTGGATMELFDPFSYSLRNWNNPVPTQDIPVTNTSGTTVLDEVPEQRASKLDINSDDEKTDVDNESSETEMGSVDEHRGLIIQLLSQLKLGMDLTQVVLPTFILEPFSLLEMYANFLSHPDMLLKIPEEETPELRMLAVVEWYLTAFHVGCKNSNVKKPYNPTLGELFLCSWHVKDLNTCKSGSGTSSKVDKLRFIAEQVSHHPLVSAFHVENSKKTLHLNANVGIKSKFMGMAVGVNVVGDALLKLVQHDEEYIINFPSAYVRSILSIPWMELGGKVTIQCNKTRCIATISFHTKPFYGGKLHRVTAEVKNGQADIICKVQGEWNGKLEFSYPDGSMKELDMASLPIYSKRVRSIWDQALNESRRVWNDVTLALRDDNLKLASEFKQKIEKHERQKQRQWNDQMKRYTPLYFQRSGDIWEYEDSSKAKLSDALSNH